jgi:hypothetical protein
MYKILLWFKSLIAVLCGLWRKPAEYYFKEIDMTANLDNPRNNDSIDKLEAEGFVGTDATLSIALFEYGLIWKEKEPGKYLFIYGIEVDGENYTKFDHILMDADDFDSDFDWVDFASLVDVVADGDSASWTTLPYPQKVYDILLQWGYQNTFGASYWGGFNIKE